jgi:hypothetical protein
VRGPTRLSKVGNAAVRRALYFPAVALRANPPARLGCAAPAAGKAKMVVVGAAMRKLLHQAQAIRN